MTTDPIFVSADELRDRRARSEKVLIVDVRSPEEYASGHVEGSVNIPLGELDARSGEIADGTDVVTVCTLGGARSCGAADLLRSRGYETRALQGGLSAWTDGQN